MNTWLDRRGDLGDPAVAYWSAAMAAVREREHRHPGVLPVVLRLAAALGAAVAGYLGGHLVGIRTPGRGQHGR